jgi:hypothetical protein
MHYDAYYDTLTLLGPCGVYLFHHVKATGGVATAKTGANMAIYPHRLRGRILCHASCSSLQSKTSGHIRNYFLPKLPEQRR